MPEVDLTYARQVFAETVLLDRCTVTRERSRSDAVLNDVTGDYEYPPGSADTVLAADEPCKVADETENPSAAPGHQHDVAKIISFEFGHLDDIEYGDIVLVTASEDPRLVGDEYVVNEVVEKTIGVARRVRVLRRTDAGHSAD